MTYMPIKKGVRVRPSAGSIKRPNSNPPPRVPERADEYPYRRRLPEIPAILKKKSKTVAGGNGKDPSKSMVPDSRRREGFFERAGRRGGAAVDRGVEATGRAARRGYDATQGAINRGVDKVHDVATRTQRKMGRAASKGIGAVQKAEGSLSGRIGRKFQEFTGTKGYRRPKNGYAASEKRAGRSLMGGAAAAGAIGGGVMHATSKWSESKRKERGY